MKQFSEATRVQMPAMVHLTRIGYTYFGKLSEDKNGTVYDGDTNILLPVFEQQFKKLNPGHEGEWMQVLKDIRKELNDDDLGRGFYNRLKVVSPVKLIDFDNIENNTFHFTAEFTCKNGQDEFRPDITLFVNGLPLCFVEVKKPNNHGGMLAESARMNKERFPNKKFRRFINITQLMIFSNNMEYDALGGIVPIQGAFYCTGARTYSPFNCFREENPSGQKIAPYHHDYPYKEIDRVAEKKILSDYNCQVIHTSPEYQTNLDFNTPTNRILTSMCSPERLLYIIRYGIAYVRMEREVDGKIESTDQKHIMRYQQLFASLAIRKKLAEGIKSGVVWHTQGSGKTALSYYLTYILNDFYSKQNKVAKFYFIVDRLDLLEQATQEFEARGLVVSTANTRAELMEQFRSNQALQGTSGQAEITVVNIQRFAEDKEKVRINDYATNLQRIFILDEAHHSPANTYQKVMNYFEPQLFLGMTATPDKRDNHIEGRNVYELFHHQIAHEIRLQKAMEEHLLCPFHYFGISDIALIDDKTSKGKNLTEKDFNLLTSEERVDHIIEQAQYYSYSGERVKGLIFCSRNKECESLSRMFNERGYRTLALSN